MQALWKNRIVALICALEIRRIGVDKDCLQAMLHAMQKCWIRLIPACRGIFPHLRLADKRWHHTMWHVKYTHSFQEIMFERLLKSGNCTWCPSLQESFVVYHTRHNGPRVASSVFLIKGQIATDY
jgi:hypothetical protein